MIPSHDEVKAAAQKYAQTGQFKYLQIVLDTDRSLRERLLESLDGWDDAQDCESLKPDKRSVELRKELG